MDDASDFTVTAAKIPSAKALELPKKKAFLERQSKTLPRLHTLCVAAAKRGGGKTTMVTNMLRGYKREGLCDRCFVVSPTCGSNAEFYDGLVNDDEDLFHEPTNASVLEIIDRIEAEAAEYKEWQETVKLYKVWIKAVQSRRPFEHLGGEGKMLPDDVMQRIDQLGIPDMLEPPKPKYAHGRPPVCHILFDDIQGSQIMRQGSPFISLCIRHRHLGQGMGCSIWILCQSYISTSSTPRPIRENAILLLLWAVRDEKLREQIAREAAGCCVSVNEFKAVFDFATSDPDGHGVLMVDYSAPPGQQFRRGLDEILSVHKKKDIQ